ncbi:MAG: hypothetical protein F6K65_36670 [Moorea sp. SIO3C2]|nr:hypothetical protein [Moorena sp. SIO3C2]
MIDFPTSAAKSIDYFPKIAIRVGIVIISFTTPYSLLPTPLKITNDYYQLLDHSPKTKS